MTRLDLFWTLYDKLMLVSPLEQHSAIFWFVTSRLTDGCIQTGSVQTVHCMVEFILRNVSSVPTRNIKKALTSNIVTLFEACQQIV